MKEKYYDQAVACVKDHVPPAQIKLYRSCDGDLDRVYGEAMNGNGYFGKVIESGHVYELGYEKCTCPKVLSGKVTDPEQCEYSRQSILYILNRLEPDSEFAVVKDGVLKHLAYYDEDHKQAVSIDFSHPHQGVQPHRHVYLSHGKNDPGVPPTTEEWKLIRRIKKEFHLK